MNTEILTPEELKAFREEHEITQGELGRALGVDYTLISRWESGDRKPPLGTGERVKQAVSLILEKRATSAQESLEKFRSLTAAR